MEKSVKNLILLIIPLILIKGVFVFGDLSQGFIGQILAKSENNLSYLEISPENLKNYLPTIQGNTILPISNPYYSNLKIVKKIKVIATGYSSSPHQTDNTPFITASGTLVRDGIIANNLLPFGTKVRFPEIYGDKIFVVEDRMNQKKGYYHVDIWFPEYEQALNFGSKITLLEILREI